MQMVFINIKLTRHHSPTNCSPELDFHSTNGPCWSHFGLAHFNALPVFTCRQNITSYSEVEEHHGCGLQAIWSSQLGLANGSVHWTSPVKQLLLGEMCLEFKPWPTLQLLDIQRYTTLSSLSKSNANYILVTLIPRETLSRAAVQSRNYTHISKIIQLCLSFNDFFKHLYHQTKHLGHEKIFISNGMDFES